ncbi:Cullin-associated NEDD8-dissociated protein 1 [Orobanche minor]
MFYELEVASSGAFSSSISTSYYLLVLSWAKNFRPKTSFIALFGEIGRKTDLSSHSQIENIIIESFQAPFEKIKSAASCALGIIAAGNLQKYLPFNLKTLVMRGDLAKANEILPSIPKEHHNSYRHRVA